MVAMPSYVSLERSDLRLRAVEDPAGLLASSDRLVLDEIQRAPELLSYIQVLVDEDDRPGVSYSPARRICC